MMGVQLSPKMKLRLRVEKNPPLFFLTAYVLVAVLGAILLYGWGRAEEGSFLDSFFTSTSALCVTGLTPVTTASHWNSFGHVVVLILIQLGGLGIMTAAAAVGLAAKQKITMASRRMLMEEKGQDGLQGVVRLLQFILRATFLIEGVGAVLLAFAFVPTYGWQGLWFAIFHSVSAFCNAGFDILGANSLQGYAGSVLVSLTISFLIIVAGLGFTVYLDLRKNMQRGLRLRNWRRLRLHTKIVLSMTVGLLLVGTLGILALEYNNPATLGPLPLGEKILAAFFQAVTVRTAGYYTVDQAGLTMAGACLSILLMFIGGGPGGTAGGIKVTTVATVFKTTVAEVRSVPEVPIFHRNIARKAARRSFALFFIALMWCLIITFLLTVTESGASFLALLFETVSAFATVGLTQNLTAQLSVLGKCFIIATMFFGKIGPLTILYALSKKAPPAPKREAEEEVLIG